MHPKELGVSENLRKKGSASKVPAKIFADEIEIHRIITETMLDRMEVNAEVRGLCRQGVADDAKYVVVAIRRYLK